MYEAVMQRLTSLMVLLELLSNSDGMSRSPSIHAHVCTLYMPYIWAAYYVWNLPIVVIYWPWICGCNREVGV